MGQCAPKGDDIEESDDDEGGKPTLASIPHTIVPTQYFGTPVPASMSGGTAQFFSLRYVGPASGPPKEKYGKSPTYWLGKDVDRALDELPFYEALLKLDLSRYKLLRDWTMSYVGILTAPVAAGKDKPNELQEGTRNLLVIHDIADGLLEKRMLDIKIGEETAVAGWQGKSKFGAASNKAVDQVTNSTREGYRLEGFDNKPMSLSSLEIGSESCSVLTNTGFVKKKSNRLQLQTLPLRDFTRAWDDMNDLEDLYVSTATLSTVENGEAVLADAVRQMALLCADAQRMPAPQMWIGSSLCLACDSGQLLNRNAALQRLSRPRPEGPSMQAADLAKVCIFDWGRSQLNTVELQASLPPAEQQKRSKYWDIWQRGMLRALFEATNLYLTQFAHKGEVLTIEVWDVDSFDPNDMISTLDVPLQATNGPEEFELEPRGSVTLEIEEVPVPNPSRLKNIWKVMVYGVKDLPKMDFLTDTDPMVRAKIGSQGGCTAIGDTPVCWDDRNADFDHPLYFGVNKEETTASLMSDVSLALGTQVPPSLFAFDPDEEFEDSVRQAHFEAFLRYMPQFAKLAR